MNDFSTTIALLALGVFLIAVPAALYFIFREMRAVRKVLQARQNIDELKDWIEYSNLHGHFIREENTYEPHAFLGCLLKWPEGGEVPQSRWK